MRKTSGGVPSRQRANASAMAMARGARARCIHPVRHSPSNSRGLLEGECYSNCLPISLHREEALHSLAGEHLTCVDVAFGIHGDHVQPEELAPVFAHAPQLRHNLAIVAS